MSIAREKLNPKIMTEPYTAPRFAPVDMEGRVISPPHCTPKDRQTNRSARRHLVSCRGDPLEGGDVTVVPLADRCRPATTGHQ